MKYLKGRLENILSLKRSDTRAGEGRYNQHGSSLKCSEGALPKLCWAATCGATAGQQQRGEEGWSRGCWGRTTSRSPTAGTVRPQAVSDSDRMGWVFSSVTPLGHQLLRKPVPSKGCHKCSGRGPQNWGQHHGPDPPGDTGWIFRHLLQEN